MKLIHIVAYSQNRAIGKDNKLLWHLGDDMIHFKKTTEGHPVLMGKNTYLSIPKKYRPLKNRLNIVLSTNEQDETHDNLTWKTSIKSALDSLQNEDKVFIIGGDSIYKQTINIIDEIIATEVNAEIEGDAFYPKIDTENWITSELDSFQKNDKNDFSFQIMKYSRN